MGVSKNRHRPSLESSPSLQSQLMFLLYNAYIEEETLPE